MQKRWSRNRVVAVLRNGQNVMAALKNGVGSRKPQTLITRSTMRKIDATRQAP
jgi:hypothetical protein